MHFGIIHYRAPGDTIDEFLDYVAETGFDVIEFQCGDVWSDTKQEPEKEAEALRKKMEARGLAASALATGNDFVHLDEAAIVAQVARMDRLSKVAVLLGAKVLRTEGGSSKDEVPKEEEGRAIGECLKRCIEFAERDDVYLAVDNHGLVTNQPETLLTALEAANSPRIGTNLDTANYRWAGYSVDECRSIYDRVASHARHTHLKDCTGTQREKTYCGTVHGEGEVDLMHAVSALKKAGYAGPYLAEWEGPPEEDSGVAYARCLEWMRKNI